MTALINAQLNLWNEKKQYLVRIEMQLGAWSKQVQADNGAEYTNAVLTNWYWDHGIKLSFTAPYSPAQNGIAKWFNCTILDLSCTILFTHNLPQFLWSESIDYVTYIHNRSYTKALHETTPEGKWGNCKLDISYLQEFGTPVWIINEQLNLPKLKPKTYKMLFMGYMDGPKAIHYYDEWSQMIKVSHNFHFQKGMTYSPPDPNWK